MLAAPTSALAHGADVDGVAGNYRSEITDAGVDGLIWNVRGGDDLIELTNDTGSVVIVFGYQGEPYLRFVPGDGVYRNAASPATYLNDDRFGDVTMPAEVSFSAPADAAAEWESVADANSYSWHDHRAHWMSRTDPPAVVADRDREHLVLEYEIPLEVAGSPVAATGELRWLANVAWWPPVVALTVGLSAVVAAVAFTTRPTPGRWVPLARVSTGIVVLVVAANIVRVIVDLDKYPTTSERLVIIITTAVTLGAIVALCARSWRGHPGGFGALAVAALMVMLLYGGEASGDMTAPQLDTSLPDVALRWTIAASYTIVAPTMLAVGIGAWWYARTQRDVATTAQPAAAHHT
jgi:hypothetical protein